MTQTYLITFNMVKKSTKNNVYSPAIGNALAVYIEILSGKLRLQDQMGEDVNLASYFDTANMSIEGLEALTAAGAQNTDIILMRSGGVWKTMTVAEATTLFGGGGGGSDYNGWSLYSSIVPNNIVSIADTEIASMEFPAFSGAITSFSAPNLLTINPNISGFSHYFSANRCDVLNLPSLTYINGNWLTSAPLVTVNISALEEVNGTFEMTELLTTQLDIGSLVTVAGPINVHDNDNLATVTVPSSWAASQTNEYIFTFCALNQASVDGILLALVNGGENNGFVNLGDGTSSAPSTPTGTGYVATLVSRGWTVYTN